LVLSSANSYDGGTVVHQGSIVLAHDDALGSGGVILSGGGLKAQSQTDVRVLQNALKIQSQAVLSGGQHGLEVAAPVTLDGSQNVVGVNDEVLISGVIANAGDDSAALVKAGGGRLTLSNANTYSGGSEIREGELKTLNAAALGSGSVVVSGGSLNLAADLSVSGATISGGEIRSESGAELLTVAGTIDARAGKISAVLGDDVDGTRLVKTTNALVVLSGSNQYSNGTVLEAGTLQIANDRALGSGSLALRGGLLKADSASETRRFSNRITIEGSVLLAGGVNGLNASGPVDLGGGVRRIGVEGDVEFSGGVRDSADPLAKGGIIKEGNGTLVLSTPNYYSGGTTINAGTLRALATNALGTGSLFVVDAGVLEVGASQNVTGVKIDGGIINASSSGAGGMAAANGAGDPVPSPNVPLLRVAGNIVALSGVNNVPLSDGVDAFGVRVPANFLKTGPGTFVTNVPSYYSGTTTLAEGVVGVGVTDAFGTGPLVMSGVRLQSVTNQPVVLNNSSVTISGNGTAIEAGVSGLTFTNDVSVDPASNLLISGTFVVNGEFNANGSHIIFDTNTVIKAPKGNFNDAKIDVTPATFDALRKRIVNVGGRSSMQILGWVPSVLPATPNSTAVLKFSFDSSSGSKVDLVLDRSSYGDVARDANSGAFGQALDRLLATHLNEADAVGALLEKLDNIISPNGLNETLRSVNPGTVYANQFAGAVKQAVAISGAIDSHLDDLASVNSGETGVSFGARLDGSVGMLTPNQIAEKHWTAWTAGYASHGSQDADSAGGFGSNSGNDNGGMLGIEREFGGLRVGFVTTTGQGAYSYTDGAARVESDHWGVGTYATVNIGAITVDASALWGRADQSSDRESFGGRVKGAFVSRNSQIGLGVAMNLLPSSSHWQFTPSARLKYVDYSQDAFEETGAGLRFGTAEVNESTLLSKLGGKLSRRGSLTRSIDFGVDGAAYWVHDFNTNARQVGLHFAGISNSSFTSLSRKGDSDSAQFNLGVQATFLPSVTLRLSGQQDWSATRSQTTGVFSVALNF
jgi:autotransporter-associated beta strand protein